MSEDGETSKMAWTIGKTALKIYGLLWMTALGGILGANLSATIGMLFFVTENKSANVQPWAHYGWYGGTALFFIGAFLGKLRFISGTSLGGGSKQPVDSSSSTETKSATAETKSETTKDASESDKQSGALGFIFACGLAGAFMGLLLGGSLLVFTFSYAYSPFASNQAVSSVKVVQEPTPGSAIRRPVFQSNHPVALYLCLAPAILGAIAGTVGGGIVVLKYRDSDSISKSSSSPTSE